MIFSYVCARTIASFSGARDILRSDHYARERAAAIEDLYQISRVNNFLSRDASAIYKSRDVARRK